MKRKSFFTKLALAFVCIFTLTLGFIGIGSTTAFAASGEHTDHTGWTALTAAPSGTMTGGNYYLTENITRTLTNSCTLGNGGSSCECDDDHIIIPNGVTVELCLNGYTLDLGHCGIEVQAGGTLKIHDCSSAGTGKLTSINQYIETVNPATIHVAGNFEIDGGTVEYGYYESYGYNRGSYAIRATGGGTTSPFASVTVNGGTLSGRNAITTYGYTDIAINGGNVVGTLPPGDPTYSYGIYVGNSGATSSAPKSVNIKITGGVVSGTRGIEAPSKYTTIEISGGKITGEDRHAIVAGNATFYLYGSPVITSQSASYTALSLSDEPNLYATATADATSAKYTGENLTLSVSSVTDGTVIVHNSTDTSKFQLVSDEKMLKEEGGNLVLATKPHTHSFDAATGVCSCGAVEISAATFPDDNFRAWIENNIAGADDGVLTVDERLAVTTIEVYTKNIADLTGIEYFTALEKLECQNNQLTSLDVSANTALTYLNCVNNQLEALDLRANAALEVLNCYNNSTMTSLNVSGTALTNLNCYKNSLTSLDLNNTPNLTALYCYQNELTSLDVSSCTALTTLSCFENKLTSLDLSNNTEILQFYANNQTATITIDEKAWYTLPSEVDASRVTVTSGATLGGNVLKNVLGNEVTYTYATGVQEKSLTVTLTVDNPHAHNFDATTHYCACGAVKISEKTFPSEQFRAWITENIVGADDGVLTADELAAVTTIEIQGITMNSIQGIEYFTSLTFLNCTMTRLSELDVSKNTALERLYCGTNEFEKLDLSNNTKLSSLICSNNHQLITIDLSNNPELTHLTCISNKKLVSIDLSYTLNIVGIEVSDCSLTSLDVSQNTVLRTLYCQNNKLTSLAVHPSLTYLNCSNNALAHLDLSANTNLTVFGGDGQTSTITIDNYSTMTANLPIGVDASKVTIVSGATLNGNVLIVEQGATEIVYTYNTGLEGKDLTVTLTVTNPHTHATSGYCDCGVVVINDKNFPDGNFRNYVSSNFDTDGNGILIPTELAAVTKIEYTDGTNRIANFAGIEYFTELTEIILESQNNLKSVDLSQNTKLTKVIMREGDLEEIILPATASLTHLELYMNNLTAIDVSGLSGLTHLNVERNSLTAIDASNNTELVELRCGKNAIKTLTINSTKLEILYVEENGLTSLDVSKATALRKLQCNNNGLQSLDLSKNTALDAFDCNDNNITSLDLSQNTALTYIRCWGNALTELDISNNTLLTTLYCNSNQISSLDLSKNTALKFLNCGINNLTSLDVPANNQFTYFNGPYQTATVTMSGNSLDLTRIDPNFDGSRATSTTTGATFNGNTLVLANDMATVTYTYATGNGSNVIEVTLTIELVDYSAQIDAIEKELNDAITELNTAINGKATPADIQTAVDTLTAAYKEADETLKQALQGEIAVNTTAITNLQTALTNAENTLDAAIKKVAADLETAKNNLQAQIDTLTTNVETNATDIAELEKAISDLDAAYQAADIIINGRLDALESADTTIKASIETLEDTLTATDKTLDNAIKALEEKLDKAVADLEKSIADGDKDLQGKIDALDTAYKAADTAINSEIVKLQKEDTAIKQSVTDLQTALTSAKSELKGLIDQVQKNLDNAEAKLNDAIAQNKTDLSKEISDLKAATETADALINGSLADLAEEDTAIRESITALTSDLATAKSELEKLIADTKTELEGKIDEVKSELDKAKTDLNNAITQNKTDLTKEIETLKKAMEDADALVNGDIADLESADTAIKADITALETSLASAKTDLETAIKAVQNNLDKAVENLNNTIAQNKTDLTAEIKAVETALKNADTVINGKIADLVAEDTEINTSISTLEKSIANTKTELKGLIDTVAKNLETAKSELGAAIVNGDSALNEKITALDTAYKAADALIKGEIAELVADDEEMSASITALGNSLETVKSELETAIAQVQKNLDDAKAELETKDNELAQKDNELKQQLDAQNDELNGKITVLIIILSMVGVISVGSAAVIVIAFVKKRKG